MGTVSVESVNSVRDLGVYLDRYRHVDGHAYKQTPQLLFWDLETDMLHTSLANVFLTINSDHRVYLVQGRLLQCYRHDTRLSAKFRRRASKRGSGVYRVQTLTQLSI